jgi:hypothetical protein
MFFFGQNFPGENESVRWCVVVMQHSVFWSLKFGVKSSGMFMQSPLNIAVVCGIDCLAYQDEFFVNNNTLDVKENEEHALDFALHLSHSFPVSVSLDFLYTAHAFIPEHSSNHCQGVHLTLSKIMTKRNAVPLSDPSLNPIRLNT